MTCLVSAEAIEVEGEQYAVIALADITERKPKDVRARMADLSPLLTAIEQMPESIVITDARGNILYVNRAFEGITGHGRKEAFGQNLRILKSGRHDAKFYDDLWATIAAGRTWRGRITNRKKDGTLFTEYAVIAPVRDDAGNVTNYVAVKRDVTREIEAEERFRLTRNIERIGRMAAGAAHDFNNVLFAIRAHVDLAFEALPENHPARTSLVRVMEEVRGASRLTTQLLAFTRRQATEPKVVNLNSVIENLSRMLQRLITERIRMRLELAPDLGQTRVGAGQFEEVVTNLVANAGDAMPDGGSLTISTQNVVFDDAAPPPADLAPGPYVRMSVTDTGVGIPEHIGEQVFEPLFTTKEKGKGTGLGLATCFSLIGQNRGHIGFTSRAGHGTTFVVHLPRIDETPEPLERSSA